MRGSLAEAFPAATPDVVVFLHGLFGALSNFEGPIDYFGKKPNIRLLKVPVSRRPVEKVPPMPLFDPPRSARNWSTVDAMDAGD